MTYKHPTREEAESAMMRLQARNQFFSEAQYIIDRHNLSQEAFQNVHDSLVHRAYMDEIEPMVRQIASIKAMAIPSYVYTPSTQTLDIKNDGLTEELRALVKQWEQMILGVRAKYYEENPA